MKSGVLMFILILLLSGCQTDDRTESKHVDAANTVKRILVYLSSDEPTAIISDEQVTRQFLAVIDRAEIFPAGLVCTDDFYRTFEVEYHDDSTRRLSFNQCGGSVFSDSKDGKDYRIDDSSRGELQSIVMSEERK